MGGAPPAPPPSKSAPAAAHGGVVAAPPYVQTAPQIKAPPWGLHLAFEYHAPRLPEGGFGPGILRAGRPIPPFWGLLEQRQKEAADARAQAERRRADAERGRPMPGSGAASSSSGPRSWSPGQQAHYCDRCNVQGEGRDFNCPMCNRPLPHARAAGASDAGSRDSSPDPPPPSGPPPWLAPPPPFHGPWGGMAQPTEAEVAGPGDGPGPGEAVGQAQQQVDDAALGAGGGSGTEGDTQPEQPPAARGP